MSHCLTCKVQLDQPGLVETADCGGDCLECMGLDAKKQLLRKD